MISSAISSLMAAFAQLDGVGKVLNHYPLDAKTATLSKEAFVAENIINLLVIRRKTAEEDNAENYAAGRHTLWIEYRRTYGGSASQQAFDAVLDLILHSLYEDETLGGTVASRGILRLTESEPNIFMNKWLTHYGRFELTVELSP